MARDAIATFLELALPSNPRVSVGASLPRKDMDPDFVRPFRPTWTASEFDRHLKRVGTIIVSSEWKLAKLIQQKVVPTTEADLPLRYFRFQVRNARLFV